MGIRAEDITGLVLAGGRGSRMGGADKGLQNHRGLPLALHALLRLQPQVGATMLNANRNLGAYEAMGVPVWPDDHADFAGPLAGMLVGLAHCETPWLVTVPCDTPNFPADLVERLAAAAQAEGADIAMAATREPAQGADGDAVARGQPAVQVQPVFCLLKGQPAGKPRRIPRQRPTQDRPLDRAAPQRHRRLRRQRGVLQCQYAGGVAAVGVSGLRTPGLANRQPDHPLEAGPRGEPEVSIRGHFLNEPFSHQNRVFTPG